jgi:hypothetical protein
MRRNPWLAIRSAFGADINDFSGAIGATTSAVRDGLHMLFDRL